MNAQESPNEVLFHEEQTARQVWLWAVVAVLCAVGVYVAVDVILRAAREAPAGASPVRSGDIIAALFGLAVCVAILLLVYFTRLVTEVRTDGLFVRYIPFHLKEKRIPLEDAVSVEPLTYRPILHYGGWGIRYTFRGKAYNVSGNRGVRIDFANGRHLLIGSQAPDELARAVRALNG